MQEQRAVESETSNVRNWRWRRQFNHVLGIGVDAPAGQPQTNAYDVHNTQQDGAPWESQPADTYYVILCLQSFHTVNVMIVQFLAPHYRP